MAFHSRREPGNEHSLTVVVASEPSYSLALDGLSQHPSSKVEVQKQRQHVRGECDWPGSDLGITLEDAEQVGHGQAHYGGGTESNGPIPVFGCPDQDDLDELTLEMFKHLLEPSCCSFRALSPDAITAGVLGKVGQRT